MAKRPTVRHAVLSSDPRPPQGPEWLLSVDTARAPPLSLPPRRDTYTKKRQTAGEPSICAKFTTMGSLAVVTSRPASAHNASDMNLPDKAMVDVNEAGYLADVLLLAADKTSEDDLDDELTQRAAALGISIPPVTPTSSSNHGADSDTTAFSSHARNTSTGSKDTADTAFSSQPSSPTLDRSAHNNPNLAPSPRARSRSLTFSQYDKYLAQVEPNLHQPKFLKQFSPPTDDIPSLFSIGTRKSVMSIKNGIKAKVRWKKRSSLARATMYFTCPFFPSPTFSVCAKHCWNCLASENANLFLFFFSKFLYLLSRRL